jgi:NAD(P)-dependent dehydrogenase (short-subunit alcohol dehydrogenase family)
MNRSFRINTTLLHQILITGAAKGLGLALVSRFLRGGFQVFAGIHASTDNLQALLRDYGPRLVLVPLEVTDMVSIHQAVLRVTSLTLALDILINNAAVYLPPSPVKLLSELDLTDGHLEATLNVNTFGPLRVTQQFLPLLEKGAGKLIINISSEAGSISDCRRTNEYAYCMSKAALNMQSRILQNDLEPRGFKVLVIHPGWMRTDMGGPEADIHPDEAAEGIFALSTKSWKAGESMYVDYQGKPLPW